MKRLITWLSCILLGGLPIQMRAQMEDSLQLDDIVLPYNESWEEGNELPWQISIHSRNLSALLKLPEVEPKDIQAIQVYIETHGRSLHIHELHQIPNLSPACIASISPHLTVDGFTAFGEKKSHINFRWKKNGNNLAMLRSQSFVQAHPHLSFGGNWSMQDHQLLPHATVYADYNRNNTHIVVGDFSPLIGQGMVGSAPSISNRGWGFAQVIRPLFRIKPYTSTIPMQQWRGVGITQQIHQWKWLIALPQQNSEKEKIIAFQYKDKTKSVSGGILHQDHLKFWNQVILPFGQHVIAIENNLVQQIWQPALSGNFVLSKKTKAKWQSQWTLEKWGWCKASQWLAVIEWNLAKGQYLMGGWEWERSPENREIGALGIVHKHMLQYQYEPMRYSKFYFRYVTLRNDDIQEGFVAPSLQHQWRADGLWRADENWSLHARGEVHIAHGQKSSLAFQDVQWHPLGKAWRVTFRYAVMHSPHWEGRIYAMEKETSGSFYIPPYYGSGNRMYVVGEYKTPRWQIQTKIGKWHKRQQENLPMDWQIFMKIVF